MVIILMLSTITCYAEQPSKLVYSKDKNIIKMQPKSPVKIKFKRDSKGVYSWEINGEDAGEIIRNNKMLEDKLIKE
jgi:predicted secreted protein